ncbi:hypothetical protein J6590_029985 [Homalodisca vitripennis]|nr:hypothetical protein J6590_029985 [Homalodisca vitripennis]
MSFCKVLLQDEHIILLESKQRRLKECTHRSTTPELCLITADHVGVRRSDMVRPVVVGPGVDDCLSAEAADGLFNPTVACRCARVPVRARVGAFVCGKKEAVDEMGEGGDEERESKRPCQKNTYLKNLPQSIPEKRPSRSQKPLASSPPPPPLPPALRLTIDCRSGLLQTYIKRSQEMTAKYPLRKVVPQIISEFDDHHNT